MGASHTSKSDTKMSSPEQNSTGEHHASSSARPLSIEGPYPSNNPSDSSVHPVANQPRQPMNLQGLLRFAMEATHSEDAPRRSEFHPLDEDRKQFLNEALSSMSAVNVTQVIQNAVKTLSNIVDIRPDDDISEHETALSTIADYVDNIDIANDFYKIGGFSIFGPCLNSPHSTIRWRTAEIIAELAQNNPFCQERIVKAGLFPTLLTMVDSDPSEVVRVKALYAISCIVRGHPDTVDLMQSYDGCAVLLRAMQSRVEKLQIKSTFLISAICHISSLQNIFTLMGIVEQVAGLLAVENLSPDFRGQLLRLLDSLTNNNCSHVLTQCRRPEIRLKSILEQNAKEMTSEELSDEATICHDLINKIFSDCDVSEER